MKHLKQFESMKDSSRFTPEYLKETTKRNLISDLENISKLVNTLIKSYSQEGEMDDETKKKILILHDTVGDIYDSEMSKMISTQKKNGKKFLSDKEIDDLINKIMSED